jgi:hypothetical protein
MDSGADAGDREITNHAAQLAKYSQHTVEDQREPRRVYQRVAAHSTDNKRDLSFVLCVLEGAHELTPM